jgi:hypothetical protein
MKRETTNPRTSYRKNETENKPLSKEILFTGGKSPEFAVFYNVAFFRLCGYLNHLSGNTYTNDKNKLEKYFTDWVSSIKAGCDLLPDKAYSLLRNYLWKGYKLNKNSSGYELKESHKNLVQKLLISLYNIRNFHSHIWHDNSVLEFERSTEAFIEYLFNDAILIQTEKYPNQVERFNEEKSKFPLFKPVDGKILITQEGRTFFLSFFLTSGEMSRFLQQRKGSRRNDTPEFKIKHLVYKEYCHRDGASRNHYGFEENMLSSLPESEKKEILSARQFSKIYNYLNDVPEISNDPYLFELYTNDKTKVENAVSLIKFCQEQNILTGCQAAPFIKVDKEGNQEIKNHIIKIKLNDSEYLIHIGYNSLFKIIIDGLRQDAPSAYFSGIESKMKSFIDEREFLFNLMSGKIEMPDMAEENNKITQNKILDDYYRYKLRSGDYLRQIMGKFLDSIEKNDTKKTNERLIVFQDEIKNSPIEITYHDFFFEEDKKPRSSQRFTEFACRYLIDNNIVPNWHWMIKKTEVRIKKNTQLVLGKPISTESEIIKESVSFQNSPDIETRLAFTSDEQVTVGVFLSEDEKKNSAIPEHKFVLGHKAIANLLIAHLVDKKDIATFFDPIINDIISIKKTAANSPTLLTTLNVLQKNEIPESFLIHMQEKQGYSIGALKEKAQKRIENLLAQAEQFATSTYSGKPLSRAEKNRIIMRWYLFFNWNYSNNTAYKFLRKDEYQKLSVYHYCLEKNDRNRKDHYSFLREGIDLHMPAEVKTLLSSSESLDELLMNTALKTKSLLEKWQKEIKDDSIDSTPILKKMGLTNSLSNSSLESWVCFDIHPILPLRVYYKNELQKENGNFSLSQKIRNNPLYTSPLHKDYYSANNYTRLGADWPKSKIRNKKITGKLNALLTEDALLALVAKKYLSTSSPAVQEILKAPDNNLPVSNTRNMPVKMKFAMPDKKNAEVVLKFHQLDDYLLVESKPVIERAVWQVITRYNDSGKEQLPGIEKTASVYRIAYDEVFQEIQRVFNQSLHWATYILNWEKEILAGISLAEKERIGKTKLPGQKEHINFKEVCSMAGIDGNMSRKISGIRNAAMHAEIPANWTYEQMEKDRTITDLLHYVPKQKFDFENIVSTTEIKK